MNDEDKVIEILGGYPTYRKLLPLGSEEIIKNHPKWWNNIVGDFPNLKEFRRRIAGRF